MRSTRFIFAAFAAAIAVAAIGLNLASADHHGGGEEGFVSLFDGKSLAGWKVSENPESVSVEDGVMKVGGGPRAHAFYVGEVGDHDFTNFELRMQVMTRPGSNSGVYFHTEYQEEGWPSKGYECQVNNTQSDWRRTGSLYAVEDVREVVAEDNEWWDYTIKVVGKRVTLTVNGEVTVDFTEPDNAPHWADMPGRRISHGTIALQAHDPGSVAYYRNIRIKPLD